MSVFALPVRRPVAVSMVFVAIILLGLIGAWKLPVELIPPLEGNDLYVNFLRPGSEPEVVERELLLPLSARASELSGVDESWGSILGSSGSYRIRFRPGTDLKVRELELRRVASELARSQPIGTIVDVSSNDLSLISRFAMIVGVSGLDDLDVMRDFVEERIEHRIAAVPGVSQLLPIGGSPREITVEIDVDRCAELNISPGEVTQALARAVGRLQYLGSTEDGGLRTSIVLDGRTRGTQSLAETRIRPGEPVRLRHVTNISESYARVQSAWRVNGEAAVGLVIFQDEGANLIRLGRELRTRIDTLNQEFSTLGVKLTVSFDGSQLVEKRLDRLRTLGATGFLIALIVLFLFLRQWRAVLVVGIAVPVSLLAALALLYLFGQSLNLITIFGLAVGIGMLVDNSIVVYEAVQRRLEHRVPADRAAEDGVRSTIRAIIAASATTAVVFLPVTFLEFDDAVLRSFLRIMTIAILLPLLGSLVVAVGLVPLLARRLAAPAALNKLFRRKIITEATGGLLPPDRGREVFGKLLMTALRRPAGWVITILIAILLTTIIALPWVAASGLAQDPPEANPVQLAIELPETATFERSLEIFSGLEAELLDVEGIDRIESSIQEGNGTLTVTLLPKEERTEEINADRIRSIVKSTAKKIDSAGIRVLNPGESSGDQGGGGGGGGLSALLAGGTSEVLVSGPDVIELDRLAGQIADQLNSIAEIEDAGRQARTGQDEYRVEPDENRLAAFALTGDQVMPALSIVRREGVTMQIGFTLEDGREIPLTARRKEPEGDAFQALNDLRLATPAGALALEAVADIRREPPQPVIRHHNGRREVRVSWNYGRAAPQTGPGREALELQISQALRNVHRPAGYTIEVPPGDGNTAWFKRILIPVILLLFAVLAITFESVTLPLLVLISLPLTLLGATWALVLTRTPAGPMALIGVVSLIGLTVNPAILLVERMQQRVRAGASAGAAALAAVRERARPVLMTTATTVAGLWPLAIVTGREDEIWPPFAKVVMGGLVTSTLLTLLAIPVGFVVLRRLDRVFGRLGPYLLIGWVAATAAIVTPLFRGGWVTSSTWRFITTVLIASCLLALAVWIFRRKEFPEPQADDDAPPKLEVRNLKKIYGKPGPVGYAWRLPNLFARRVLARGGSPFHPSMARSLLAPFIVMAVGTGWLSLSVGEFWGFIFWFITASLVSSAVMQVRRARGIVDTWGRALPGGIESWISVLVPWVFWFLWTLRVYIRPKFIEGGAPMFRLWLPLAVAVVIAIVQFGRSTARAETMRGERTDIEKETTGTGRMRALWRAFALRFFGLDLEREEVRALTHLNFVADGGMIGILGPNGAGKTTMLRQLAGILEPTRGTIHIGQVRLEKLKRYLARWVGYLPQEFGLPDHLTAREYLDYFALLYDIQPASRRRERVNSLLEEVGLGDRANDKISGYSGGMRQRVAVARTLLRLPPLIIVDEPTVGLDPRERIRFRNLLSRLARGRIILFSTHVVEDVAVACSRVLVLVGGRMQFDGDPMELSRLAEGKVWKLRLLEEERDEIDSEATIVDEVPEGGGMIRLRVLHHKMPHPVAEQEAASLEDGYLVLTHAVREV